MAENTPYSNAYAAAYDAVKLLVDHDLASFFAMEAAAEVRAVDEDSGLAGLVGGAKAHAEIVERLSNNPIEAHPDNGYLRSLACSAAYFAYVEAIVQSTLLELFEEGLVEIKPAPQTREAQSVIRAWPTSIAWTASSGPSLPTSTGSANGCKPGKCNMERHGPLAVLRRKLLETPHEDKVETPNKPVPLAGRTPKSVFQDTRYIRRLCRFDYQCRLCGGEHFAESYISLPAENLDDYVAGLKRFVSEPGSIRQEITNAARVLHEEKGDFYRLLRKAKTDGFYGDEAAVKVALTAESEYICDSCQQTFERR